MEFLLPNMVTGLGQGLKYSGKRVYNYPTWQMNCIREDLTKVERQILGSISLISGILLVIVKFNFNIQNLVDSYYFRNLYMEFLSSIGRFVGLSIGLTIVTAVGYVLIVGSKDPDNDYKSYNQPNDNNWKLLANFVLGVYLILLVPILFTWLKFVIYGTLYAYVRIFLGFVLTTIFGISIVTWGTSRLLLHSKMTTILSERRNVLKDTLTTIRSESSEFIAFLPKKRLTVLDFAWSEEADMFISQLSRILRAPLRGYEKLE